MEDVIDLIRDEEILRYILSNEAVVLVPGEVLNIGEMTCDEIVDRDHAMAFREKPIGQVRPEETGAASDNRDQLLGSLRGHDAVYLNATASLRQQKQTWPERPNESAILNDHLRDRRPVGGRTASRDPEAGTKGVRACNRWDVAGASACLPG